MISGVETARRTLNQEHVSAPCICASWLMKGSYYSRVTGRDYWSAKEEVFLQALPRLGVNLCPQWAMPQNEAGNAGAIAEWGPNWSNRLRFSAPEQILPLIESLPEDRALERDFDIETFAAQYARDLQAHTAAVNGEVLFLGDFGQADFMGPYNDWGYEA